MQRRILITNVLYTFHATKCSSYKDVSYGRSSSGHNRSAVHERTLLAETVAVFIN